MNSVEEKILAAARYKLNVDEKVSSEFTGINPKLKKKLLSFAFLVGNPSWYV